MRSLGAYCLEQFGEKVYKLALSAGTTCPNRDGTLGTGGCIFCSQGGSGDFAQSGAIPVDEQIDRAKARVAKKFKGSRYIAYFQSYTATYAPVAYLEPIFTRAAQRADIAAVSVATRPDCLPEDILAMLGRVNAIKPVWVELGLQSANARSAQYIRRGYPLEVYDRALGQLNAMGLHTVTHIILGLPGETRQDMLRSVEHAVRAGTGGVKLQLLHVLQGTDLARDYVRGAFQTLTLPEYVCLVADCVQLLPPETVVHRLTGDGPKRLLLAPSWSADKKRVLNALNAELKSRNLLE